MLSCIIRRWFAVQLITDFKLLEKVVKAFADNSDDQQYVALTFSCQIISEDCFLKSLTAPHDSMVAACCPKLGPLSSSNAIGWATGRACGDSSLVRRVTGPKGHRG